MSKNADKDHVPKRVEEVLIRAMKHDALTACKEKGRAYAQCCDGAIVGFFFLVVDRLFSQLNTYHHLS